MWRNQNPPCVAGGLGNGATTVESSLAAPQTVKHKLTVNTSNLILCSYTREVTTHVCTNSSPRTSTAAELQVQVPISYQQAYFTRQSIAQPSRGEVPTLATTRVAREHDAQ